MLFIKISIKLKLTFKNKVKNLNNFIHNNTHAKREKDYHCDGLKNCKDLIDMLNSFKEKTKQTNIIFSDLFLSKTCFDKNAFYLFEY